MSWTSLITDYMRATGLARRFSSSWHNSRPPAQHPVCHDLKSWALSHSGADYLVLDPPHDAIRPLPKTIEPRIDDNFIGASVFPIPERALVKIPAARVRGHSGLAILPSGEFVGELVAVTEPGRQLLRRIPAYSEPLPRKPKRVNGTYYMVLGVGVTNYCHFMQEIVIPLCRVIGQLPAETKLLVPDAMYGFQRDSLEAVGLGGAERVPFPDGELWELEALYVVIPRQSSLVTTSDHYRCFREAIHRASGYRVSRTNRRIYITRRFDRYWRATNEGDVERILQEHGFETVAPAQLTFQQQIELFSEAEIIVGTGAGLTNMVFGPPGAKVLQFQDPNHIRDNHWSMAIGLGMDYHYFLCDPVGTNNDGPGDMHVPIDKLKASLDQILS